MVVGVKGMVVGVKGMVVGAEGTVAGVAVEFGSFEAGGATFGNVVVLAVNAVVVGVIGAASRVVV